MGWFVYRMITAVSAVGLLLVVGAAGVGQMIPTGQMIPLNLNDDIYLLDVNRRLIANLTQSTSPERSPSIAPDGSQIIFSVDEGFDLNLFTASLYGLNRANLTSTLPNLFFAYPAWSPDGTQIAFASEQPIGDLDIFLLRLGDGSVRRLTHNPYGDNMPAWSPDGTQIVYVAANPNDPADLLVLNINCADCEPELLNAGAGIDFYPAWSPDNTRIAFISNRSGQYDLYILGTACLETDSCAQQNPLWLQIPGLTPAPLLWSADGEQVIFQSGRGGRLPDLFAVDANCYAATEGCIAEQYTQLNRVLWASRWRWGF